MPGHSITVSGVSGVISNVTIFLLQIGIFIVYFLDNILGSGWWVMVLYMIQLFAVLVVRGKPYGAEQIVTVLFPKKACCSSILGPMLAFTWNVVSHLISVNLANIKPVQQTSLNHLNGCSPQTQ